MEASKNAPSARRSRYVRSSAIAPVVLSPLIEAIVIAVAEYGVLTSRQLVLLTGRSQKAVNRACRAAFDAGLLDVLPVPRAALAEPGECLTTGHLFGSAPNVFTVSSKGLRQLRAGGHIERDTTIPAVGPKTALFFLSHRLMVSDVRIYFHRCAEAAEGQSVVVWHEASDAEIDLNRSQQPKVIRPDAWTQYQVGSQTLIAMVEADRGSEKLTQWLMKIAAYDLLLFSSRLKEVTGFNRARLLVITVTAKRREHLAALLHTHASPALQERIWLADQSALSVPDLTRGAWQQPGSRILRPLIPPSVVTPHVAEEA